MTLHPLLCYTEIFILPTYSLYWPIHELSSVSALIDCQLNLNHLEREKNLLYYFFSFFTWAVYIVYKGDH